MGNYTDIFIKIPTLRYSVYDAQSGKEIEDCDKIWSYSKIRLDDIVSYEPSVPPGREEFREDNFTWTYIYCKHDNFSVPISIDKFEQLLNKEYERSIKISGLSKF